MVQRRWVCARAARRRARAAGAGFVGVLGSGALFHNTGRRESYRRKQRGIPRAVWRRNGSGRLLRCRFGIAAEKLAGTGEAREERWDEWDRARFDGNRTALDAAGGWRSGESVLRVERAATESFGLDAGRLAASSAQSIGGFRLGGGVGVFQ